MKYRDKNTIILNEKYSDKSDWVSSNRNEKRVEKKLVEKVSKLFNKNWWDCLSDCDRESIRNEFMFYSKFKKYNKSFVPSIWVTGIQKKFKPNVILYRDKKIDCLLNEM